ncbi:MAG TPA: hypothetical protein VLL98_02350 [Rickettsiales bacterium]|nr:hypothetical protein [Rickettsiales bacterium]
MVEKNSIKNDYKFWITVILLVFICGLQIINLHKLNRISHKERWANRVDRLIYNKFPIRQPIKTKKMSNIKEKSKNIQKNNNIQKSNTAIQ